MSERIITDLHWLVITNPKSGQRNFAEQYKYVLQKLDDAEIPYYFKKTEYSGHAIEIAKKYARHGCVNFLVLGGDGTVNEVLNGIFSANIDNTSVVKLAVMPRGTGNDWARFWGIRKNDVQAMKYFLQGNTKLIDIGKVEYKFESHHEQRFFINSIGFGLDSYVVDLTHRYKKLLGSFSFLYTIALLVALINIRIKKVSVTIDNKEDINHFSLLTMNIANGPYSGGGIKQNPSAVPYDGTFDMIMVGELTLANIFSLLTKLFNGKLTNHPKISSYRTKEVHVSSEENLMVETDGVIIDQTNEYTISILPNAIQMVVPE